MSWVYSFAVVTLLAFCLPSASLSNEFELQRVAQNLVQTQPVQQQIADHIKAGKTSSARLQLSMGFTPEESEIARKIAEREWDQSWVILQDAFVAAFSNSMSAEQINMIIQSVENPQLQKRTDRIRVVLPAGNPEVDEVRKAIEAEIQRKQRAEIGK